MPVQFRGVIDEHKAVRERVGLFDVSHMGEVAVHGRDAQAFLQRVTCNDVGRLGPGRVQYSALTTEQGTFVDDLLVYALGADAYMLVLNAGNTAKGVAWLRDHTAAFDVVVTDESERWALLSLQGPRALDTLAPLTAERIAELRYYRFARADVCGAPCVVSRTG
jgi:aminomethyltransferase